MKNTKPIFSRFKRLLHNINTNYHSDTRKALQRPFLCILGAIILFFSIEGCKTHRIMTENEQTIVHYVDSTIWHDDTAYFQVPVEVYRDYSGILDTLRLETNYAKSWSAVDTNSMLLVGEITNKPVHTKIEYKWKERIITNDSIVEITKEVPVEVEVQPKHPYFWRNCFIILACLFAAFAAWKW